MRQIIKDLSQQLQRPFYLYDQKTMIARAELLKRSLPGFDLLYSIKANPFAPVVRCAAQCGFGADAASAAEVEKALAAGIAPGDIYYSTPGKTRADLEAALGRATVIADSLNELALLNELAAGLKEPLEVGLRINPEFTMDGDEGRPNKFGVDQESLAPNEAFLAGLKRLKVTGLHIHLKSQVTDADTLALYCRRVFQCADFCRSFFPEINFINFGGGLGLPLGDGQALDLSALGKMLAQEAAAFEAQKGGVRLLIETGRYLAGPVGCYITEIVDIKVSRGRKFLIVAGGLNGFLRPVMAQFLEIARAVPDPCASLEPLFSGPGAFEFTLLDDRAVETELVTVAGNLCAGVDFPARDIRLPRAEIGDLLMISNAGCYGFSLSPHLFSSHRAPGEYFLTLDGALLEG